MTGAQLNAALHTALFGKKVHWEADWPLDDATRCDLPDYSGSWRGMKWVVDAMRSLGFSGDITWDADHFGVAFQDPKGTVTHREGEQAPETMAEAALAALGVRP